MSSFLERAPYKFLNEYSRPIGPRLPRNMDTLPTRNQHSPPCTDLN